VESGEIPIVEEEEVVVEAGTKEKVKTDRPEK
jgi:hypothetical protein